MSVNLKYGIFTLLVLIVGVAVGRFSLPAKIVTKTEIREVIKEVIEEVEKKQTEKKNTDTNRDTDTDIVWYYDYCNKCHYY